MNEVQALYNEFQTTEKKLNQRLGAKAMLEDKEIALREELATLDANVVSTEKAIWLLQQYAENQQNLLSSRIEGIVTRGLRAVFQDPSLEFKLRYSENKKGDKSKRPEVSMSVLYDVDGTQVEGNLKNSFGGGLSVVAATLLRIVVVLHLPGRVAPIIVLDEPLKDLSPSYDGQDEIANGYRERMSDFLRSLVAETDLQIIMVSHEPEYGRSADVHHRFKGGVGQVSNVKSVENEGDVDEMDQFE